MVFEGAGLKGDKTRHRRKSTEPRSISVDFVKKDLSSTTSDDETIYLYLLLPTQGKGLEAIATSRIPFSNSQKDSIDYNYQILEVDTLSGFEDFAKKNHAKLDYTPAVLRGFEAYLELECNRD